MGMVKKKRQFQPNFEWHKGFKWVTFGTVEKPVVRAVQHVMKDVNKGRSK
jgi:hypothetical protein